MEKEKKEMKTNLNRGSKKSTNGKKTSNNVAKKKSNQNIKNNVKKTDNGKTKAMEEQINKSSDVIKETIKPEKVKGNIKEIKAKKILTNDTDFAKYIKIILIITVILLMLYFVTYFFLNKDGSNKENDKTSSTATIQYEEILASRMLSQSNKEYYVFIYDKNDSYMNTYETYLSLYKYKENSKKIYRIDLNSDFNKSIKGNENNHLVSNMNEFKTSNTTFVKIVGGKIVEAYHGSDKIVKVLKEISE